MDDRKPLIWAPSARTREEAKIWVPGAKSGSPQVLKPERPRFIMMERRPIEVIHDPKLVRDLDKRFRAWGQ